MIKGIPWNDIGPIAIAVIVILSVVFGFILKFQKGSKATIALPKDINSTGKKTLCFTHEGKIGANEQAIKMISDQMKIAHDDNREDHGKIESKIEAQGKEILQAIDESSIRE